MNNINNDKNSQWKEREVGALWKKKSDKGSYCTGYLVVDELGQKIKRRVIMFANKQKNKETSPDFIVYLSNEDNADEAKTARPKTTAAKAPAPVAVASDDIPDDLQ
jgi:uncharacterized protein (DUF736 family)